MWKPEEKSLEILVDLLNQVQSNDNEKQKVIYKQFNDLSKNSEFSNYLIYILSQKSDPKINSLRQVAGIVLKGVVERVNADLLASSLEYIQSKLFETFEDPSAVIRSTVSYVMASLSLKIGHKNWPALIKFHGEILLNNQVSSEYAESSLDCLLKIIEDIKLNSENIEGLDDVNDPLNQLIPILMQNCNPNLPEKIKALSIECLNAFTFIMSPIFLSNMNNYMEILFLSAEDKSELVRLRSCQGFFELLATRKDLITHSLIKIIEQILKFTMDQNKEVVHAAVKFWNEFMKEEAEEDDSRVLSIGPYLEKLVPLLVENLRYSDEDMMNLDSTKSKNANSNSQNVFFGDDEEDGIQQVEDDEDNFGQDEGEWTLRRECAHLLDTLAKNFKNVIFDYAQVKIAEFLQAKDWQTIEAGMLGIGSVGKGSQASIIPHLGDIFPFLMMNVENENPLVRSMSIWTLSRFTNWILEKASEDITIIKEYMIRVLKGMMDDHPETHKAACTAFSKICNADPTAIKEFLKDILEVLKAVADKYKGKQAGSLYDVVATISYSLETADLQNEEVETVLMKILYQNWEAATFDDPESNMLIECTDSVLGALDNHIYNHLDFFIPKIFYLIANYLESRKAKDSKTLYHKREIALRCLEVFGTTIKMIKGDIEKFISPQDFIGMITSCCEDTNLIFKQWIMSTIGEAARYHPNLLSGSVVVVLQKIAENLKTISEELGGAQIIISVCNNAAWALGLICESFAKEAAEYIPELIKKVVLILTSSERLHIVLAQNLAIAIGRMALSNPSAVSVHLQDFLKPFCLAIDKTREEEEKNQAIRGLLWAIAANPQAIIKDFHFLCLILAGINPNETELKKNAAELIQNFKSLAGNQWNQYFLGFPVELQQKMKMAFGVE